MLYMCQFADHDSTAGDPLTEISVRGRLRVISFALGLFVFSAPTGATSAKEWQGLSRDEQRGVVLGVINAWEHAGSVALMAGQTRLGDFYIAPLQCMQKLDLGSKGESVEHDLVTRYVAAQPSAATQDIARVIRNAIMAACEKTKGK